MLIVQIDSFSVAVTRLQDVPYFGPALPEKGRFKKNQEFREFLITKCKYAEYSYWIGTFYVQCTQVICRGGGSTFCITLQPVFILLDVRRQLYFLMIYP